MASFTIQETVTYSGQSVSKSNTLTGGQVTLIDGETVATAQTDVLFSVTVDVSQVKAFYLVSDQDVTFETNSGSSPTNTIALKANIPYIWYTNKYDTFKLTSDVTAVYITNASGSTATIYMFAVLDVTP